MIRRNWLWLIVVGSLVAFGLACDEDTVFEPPGNEEPEDTLRNSITSLIEVYFAGAYSRMDSAAYEEALDTSYQFQLLPQDIDPGNPDQDWWDKTTEMMIAGHMFSGRPNQEHQEVRLIGLTLDEKLTAEDNTPYEQKPAGETWYKTTATVDLLVTVYDPDAGDWEITNYVVYSEQIFVCRPDPDDGEKWVIFRQLDQPFINKNEGGTEESSWGSVKDLFR